jgi:ribonuclease P protein component
VSCLGAAPRDASVSRSDEVGVDRTFARASRLRTRKSFLDLYERGTRVRSAFFVLFGLPGVNPRSRLGITATKKFGHAVARNRIKRLVREIFRRNRGITETSIDVVVNVKTDARLQPYERLEADLTLRLRELRTRLGR